MFDRTSKTPIYSYCFHLDFVYYDQQTGIRWIATKARSQPMNTLLSRVSWKPKINHYEKYSDVIRMSKTIFQFESNIHWIFLSTDPKRTVPVKSFETIRKKLTQPWASWRIDRLTTYLADLVRIRLVEIQDQ